MDTAYLISKIFLVFLATPHFILCIWYLLKIYKTRLLVFLTTLIFMFFFSSLIYIFPFDDSYESFFSYVVETLLILLPVPLAFTFAASSLLIFGLLKKSGLFYTWEDETLKLIKFEGREVKTLSKNDIISVDYVRFLRLRSYMYRITTNKGIYYLDDALSFKYWKKRESLGIMSSTEHIDNVFDFYSTDLWSYFQENKIKRKMRIGFISYDWE